MRGDEQAPAEVRSTGQLPSEVVLGLHWDPASAGHDGRPVDLDAICMLFAQDGSSEMIHPGNPCGAAGSVVHTGDSRTGASPWDDERVFVFLEALPRTIDRITFLVCSVTGQPFHEIRGARCHLSDRQTEIPWLHVDLTSYIGQTEQVVACLERSEIGWRLVEPDLEAGHRP